MAKDNDENTSFGMFFFVFNDWKFIELEQQYLDAHGEFRQGVVVNSMACCDGFGRAKHAHTPR